MMKLYLKITKEEDKISKLIIYKTNFSLFIYFCPYYYMTKYRF